MHRFQRLSLAMRPITALATYLIHLVPPPGIEPSSADYKTAASPFMLKGLCLVHPAGLEPTCTGFVGQLPSSGVGCLIMFFTASSTAWTFSAFSSTASIHNAETPPITLILISVLTSTSFNHCCHFLSFIWYSRRDSNSQALLGRQILSLVCIPFHHWSLILKTYYLKLLNKSQELFLSIAINSSTVTFILCSIRICLTMAIWAKKS